MFRDAPRNTVRRRGRFVFVFLISQLVLLALVAAVAASDLSGITTTYDPVDYQDKLLNPQSSRTPD